MLSSAVTRLGRRMASTFNRVFNGAKDTDVYELRTYAIDFDAFPKFMNLTTEHLHMRMAHSPLIGYWTLELGGRLNSVVHLWRYESLSHRAEVRKALLHDQAWNQAYMSKMKPYVVSQEAKLLHMPQLEEENIDWVYKNEDAHPVDV